MKSASLKLALVFSLLFAGSSRGEEGLETKVANILKTSPFQHAQWGLLVVDSATGKTIYEKNPDQMFCPASVTKLYSTAAAWVDLGPEHRFETNVVKRGSVDASGTLHGDLILIASGDLSLGGRTGPAGTLLFEDNDHIYAGGNNVGTLVPCDPLAGLDELSRGISNAGIKRIDGDVLIDDRLFEPAISTGSGPRIVTSIMVNDNIVDVVATPGAKTGDPATIRLVPETAFVSVDARVETVSEKAKASVIVHSAGPRAFTVCGSVPVGHKPLVKTYYVDEPASFARALLIESLRRKGVRVDASPLASNLIDRLPTKKEVAALPRVASYTSPPLREFVKVVLKVSHNLHASTLPLLIAVNHGDSSLNQGLRRQGNILKELGVDVSSVSFGGGAGGDRADLTTPRATVALLRALAKRPDWPSYMACLPVLGEDGTLAKAVSRESAARGHARGKTGTYWLDNALNGKSVITSKALAGTVDTADGRNLTFAFFLNNVPIDESGIDVSEATAKAGRLLGSLCEVFYESKAGAK